MKKTDEFELIILRELVKHGDMGRGGIPEKVAKKLFYDTLGSVEEGEEFFSQMFNANPRLVTFNKLDKEYTWKDGTKTIEQFWYFATADGGFKLKNLKKTRFEERRNLIFVVVGIVVAIVSLILVFYPPHHEEVATKTISKDSVLRSVIQHSDTIVKR